MNLLCSNPQHIYSEPLALDFFQQTIWLFIRDMIKGILLSILLGPPIVAAIIIIVQVSPVFLPHTSSLLASIWRTGLPVFCGIWARIPQTRRSV